MKNFLMILFYVLGIILFTVGAIVSFFSNGTDTIGLVGCILILTGMFSMTAGFLLVVSEVKREGGSIFDPFFWF